LTEIEFTEDATVAAQVADGPGTYGEGVYIDTIHQLAELPAIVVQLAGEGIDTNTQMRSRGMVQMEYMVKALDSTGNAKETVWALASAIDEAIHGGHYEADGFELDCHRVRSISLPGDFEGKTYRQVGGIYRVIVRPTTA
jgi:hypothetical protein